MKVVVSFVPCRPEIVKVACCLLGIRMIGIKENPICFLVPLVVGRDTLLAGILQEFNGQMKRPVVSAADC